MAIAKLFALNANAIMWRYWWLILMNPWNEAKANNYLIIFRMRYYPGTNFDFIGWFCRTEPVSLCKLVSMWDGGREGTGGGRGGSNMAEFGTSSGPYTIIWVGKAEGTTDVFWHHLHFAYITTRYSFEHIPTSQTTYVARFLDCMG